MSSDELFFGLDLSTQQLKIITTDLNLKIHSTYTVEFDKDLPHYKTNKGVYSNEITGEIYTNVSIWIEALDLILSKMKLNNFPFDKIKGISGSCQQHGSVYWSKDANNLLSSLSIDKSLKDQLIPNAFTLQTSPNWQDHSTGEEILKFETYLNGAEHLAQITGSRAHYRFTGPQIRKIVKNNNEIYHKTFRISLVSSFLQSLLCGQITNIEEADACGMNLFDINKRNWNDELLSIATLTHDKDLLSSSSIDSKDLKLKAINELKSKLGEEIIPIDNNPKSLGSISKYFVEKYKFSSNCKIYSFTGDNLATILSIPLQKDEILISLGTSTTVLLITENYIPSSNYHLFIHPTIPNTYMGMICYCNGSLAREKIRDLINLKFQTKGWTKFDEILDKFPSFNNKLGIYFPIGEIVPNSKPQTLRGKLNPKTQDLEIVDSWDIELDVSSIVESQALSCRIRSSPMLSIRSNSSSSSSSSSSPILEEDLKFDGKYIPYIQLQQRPNKVFYVGGGSQNQSIVSKFGQILGSLSGDFKIDNSNACAIGGAFKATWSWVIDERGNKKGFHEFLTEKFDWNALNRLDIDSKWNDYTSGIVLLNKLENELK
ncbi:hypothetical protein WICMUC_003935 [Wickerhamomyces mucosus]|uniref:Xylulose kinase n=1 Tax=Wickerhamomyces mucosus TaxID=1378264 RepID=A0A9P8PJR4_9ASCO|nr:hypothetical protein WICMUC_003935 [Wickerhamomyces mucosus]